MHTTVVLRNGQVRRWREGFVRKPDGEFVIWGIPNHDGLWHVVRRGEPLSGNPEKWLVSTDDLRDESELLVDVVVNPPPESDISRLATAIEKLTEAPRRRPPATVIAAMHELEAFFEQSAVFVAQVPSGRSCLRTEPIGERIGILIDFLKELRE